MYHKNFIFENLTAYSISIIMVHDESHDTKMEFQYGKNIITCM